MKEGKGTHLVLLALKNSDCSPSRTGTAMPLRILTRLTSPPEQLCVVAEQKERYKCFETSEHGPTTTTAIVGFSCNTSAAAAVTISSLPLLPPFVVASGTYRKCSFSSRVSNTSRSLIKAGDNSGLK